MAQKAADFEQSRLLTLRPESPSFWELLRVRFQACARALLLWLSSVRHWTLPFPVQQGSARAAARLGFALFLLVLFSVLTFLSSSLYTRSATRASIVSGIHENFDPGSDLFLEANLGPFNHSEPAGIEATGTPASPQEEGPSEPWQPPNLWPLPREFTLGSQVLIIPRNLTFRIEGPAHKSQLLLKAFQACKQLIFQHPPRTESTRVLPLAASGTLPELVVRVHSANEELQLYTSEEYILEIPSNGTAALLQAETVYGALHGLETFSQLCEWEWDAKAVGIRRAPWRISDGPHFPYRGLLLDSARHFWPLPVVKRLLESMAYTKLNVLHWHLVDWQAFPLEVPSLPRLWEGAWTPEERYSVADVAEVVEFAREKGIMVIPEIDVPGHTKSWGFGYPQLWPSPTCTKVLDVSKNDTFEFLDILLGDLRKMFPGRIIHLGGDEVELDCWEQTPHIQQWLQERGWSSHEAYLWFVQRASEIAASYGWDVTIWEEPFQAFGTRLHNSTIIQDWLGRGALQRAVQRGFRAVKSNGLYLDWLNMGWHTFYEEGNPGIGISQELEHRVLGAEVCMWAERVDPANLLATVYPRTAAAAEALWSPSAVTARGPEAARPRLLWFKCLLNARGIEAAPLFNPMAHEPPEGPGSCFRQ